MIKCKHHVSKVQGIIVVLSKYNNGDYLSP